MFDFLTKFFSKPKQIIPYSNRGFYAGGAIPSDWSNEDYLQSYLSVGWWHAVVFRIALGMSEVKWTLSDVSNPQKPKQVFQHPILNLLSLANPFQTSEELIALDTIYMECLGESFWVLNNNGIGEPAEIILPYPTAMQVVPDKNFPFVKGYIYGRGEDRIPLDVNQVIHFKYPNPMNQFRGLGQATAIGVNLSAERNADKWVDQFFYNSARPDGVIQFDYTLSDEQFDKLKKQWSEKYKGVNKAHQVALLEGGGKYVQIQNSVKDMDFPNLKQKNRDIILGIEGMPLSVMGITENVNRCLSENHRIFTENGLRYFADLSENDKVLTFNPELKVLEFQKPLNIYSYDYDDDLIIFHNTRIHAEVTPNHRLYIAGSNCKAEKGIGEYKFRQARDLETSVISHWLMASGKAIDRESPPIINIPKVEYVRTGNKGNEPPDDGYNIDAKTLASFCGLMGSEGWLAKGFSKGIGFGCSLNTKALNSFEELIDILPFGEWKYWDNPNGSKNGMRSYQIANKTLWTWLLENIGAGAKNKHVPEFVLKGSSEIMQSFLDTYIEGDGHICNKNNTVLIRSHSPRMVDELLQLAVMLGYHASISGKTGVIISKGGTSYFRNQRSIHREHYQGKVWCVEIPNGIFFTECNGKVHATGNSNAEAGDYTFARWVLKPRLDWKKAKLQEQLIPKFKNSQKLKLGFEEIVPETIEQRMQLSESGMRSSTLKIDEARKMKGLDPVGGELGDCILIPVNMKAVNSRGEVIIEPTAQSTNPNNETPKSKSLTPDQRRLYWERFAQKTSRQEEVFRQVFFKVFDGQRDFVAETFDKTHELPSTLDDEATARKFEPVIQLVYSSGFEDALPKQEEVLDEHALEWISTRSLFLAKSINKTTLELLRAQLQAGFAAGESIPQLAKRIVGYFDETKKWKAEQVARSEVIAASNEGALYRYSQAGIEKAIFNASFGACPVCEELDGKEYPVSEAHGVIPVHPNCLLPDVRVETPHIVSGSRAFYNGQAVELTTQNGYRLALTPNHMILTPTGFIKAKALHEGDYIISSPDSKRMIQSIDPDYDQRPTFVADIWDSLLMTPGMSRTTMPISPIDFYGDAGGFDGNIDIIYPDSLLLNNVGNSAIMQHINKDTFSHRNPQLFPFNRQGMAKFGSSAMVSSLYSDVSLTDSSHSLFGSHSGHRNNVGFASITGHNASIQEPFTDNIPAYTKLAREFQFRFSSFIAFEQIIKVRYFNYVGHVYDLQTLEGLYIANGVAVKNCRCVWYGAV